VTQLRLGNNRKVTREGYARLIEASSFVPTLLDAGKQAEESLRLALRERFGKALVTFSR
jgi:hypothetical protein